MTALARVDLPQPLSPTRPTIWPGCTLSDTPSTADTVPLGTVKPTRRSVTVSAGAVIGPRLGGRGGCAGRRR